MKHYLKKNDNEFKDRFLSKVKEFNNVLYDLKDNITNSIEATMQKINKELEEGRNKNEKLLKEKISEDEKVIKEHELECKPKIEELTLEAEKWKVKSESISNQIIIKDNLIGNENIPVINFDDYYSKRIILDDSAKIKKKSLSCCKKPNSAIANNTDYDYPIKASYIETNNNLFDIINENELQIEEKINQPKIFNNK